MTKFIVITVALFAFLSLSSVARCAEEVICYIPSWGPDITDKVSTSDCSIFVIAFGSLDANGNVGLPDNFGNFKKLKTANSKLLLAIGGATAGTTIFKQNAATSASRERFAKNVLDLVKNNGLDGVDIDWEFPDASDRATFVELHSDLKAWLKNDFIVSTAVSVGKWLVSTQNVYDIAGLANAVDHINLMTYDMHMDEQWDSSTGVSFNAPINAISGDSVDNGINLFLKGGAPANKLMVGVPFYGRQYELADSSKTAVGSPFQGGHQASDTSYTPAYNSYCPKLSDESWTKERDQTANAPFMFNGNMWISYEDEESISEKANLANKYNLGGVMTWNLQQDDYDGVCSACKWPLLKALNGAIGRTKSSSDCKRSGGNKVKTVAPIVKTSSPSIPSNDLGEKNLSTNCDAAGLSAHPSDCSKYLSCTDVGTEPFVMSCSSELKWNNEAKSCDWNCVA